MKKFKRILALVLAIMTVVSTMSVGVSAVSLEDVCVLDLLGWEHTLENCEATGVKFTKIDDECVEAECNEVGYDTYSCDSCGTKFVELVNALGHDYQPTVIIRPKCTTPGVGQEICTKCSDKKDPYDISCDGHVWKETIVKVPTNTTKGEVHFACVNCDVTKTIIVEELCIHEWEYVSAKAAKCEDEGNIFYAYCAKCDTYKNEDGNIITAAQTVISAKGHQGEIVDTTLCDKIVHTQYCPVCDTTITTETKLDNKKEGVHQWTPTIELTKDMDPADKDTYLTALYNDLLNVPANWNVHQFQCMGEVIIYRYCEKCGHFETDIKEFKDHVWAVDTTKTSADVCVNGGLLHEYCIACGALEDGQYVKTKTTPIDAGKGHDMVELERVEPTCTEDGYVIRGCKVCVELLGPQTETLPATGHKFEKMEHAATCAAARYTCDTCTVCGYQDETTKSDPIDEKDSDAHEIVTDIIIEATCSNVGQALEHCKYCDAFDKVVEVPALKCEDYEYTIVTKLPTCTEKGEGINRCTLCGNERSVEIKAIGHDWYTIETTPATCSAYAVEHKVCKNCGDTKDVELENNGYAVHTFADWILAGENLAGLTEEEILAMDSKYEMIRPATCSNAGLAYGTCKNCGDRIFIHIPAKEHKIVKVEGTGVEKFLKPNYDATCGVHARVYYKCEERDCGAYFMELIKEMPATNHNHTSKVTKAATCVEDGVRTYTCTYCGNTYTETISATGEHITNAGKKFASCADLVWGESCKECGLTHEHLRYDREEATCISLESILYFCKDCEKVVHEDVIGEEGDYAPHNYEIVTDIEATCIAAGEKLEICTVCGKENHTDRPINPDAHKMGEWEYLQYPTATQAGVKVRYCELCNEPETEAEEPNTNVFEYKYEIKHVDKIGDEYEADNDAIVNSGLVELTIKTNAAIDLYNALLRLEYDQEILSFVEAKEPNGQFRIQTNAVEKVDENGNYLPATITVYATSKINGNTSLQGEDVFVKLYFRVKGDAYGENITFKLDGLTELSQYDEDGNVNVIKNKTQSVDFGDYGADIQYDNTTVATIAMLGDLVDDVDWPDAIRAGDHAAMRKLMQQENSIGDIDKNGRVDMNDYNAVGQYLLGIISYDELVAIGTDK